MPLAPPTSPVEHPADLVVDAFGTFLGKRSERLVVRWRESAAPAADDLLRQRPTAQVLKFPTPDNATDSSSTHVLASSGDENANAPGNMESRGDEAASTPQAGPDTREEDSGEESQRGRDPSSADDSARRLIDLWAQETPIAARSGRPSSSARLADELRALSGSSAVPTGGGWREQQVPFCRLRSVTVTGRGVTLSSDLIEALLERGIGLAFLSGRGQPIAHLSAPGLGGTVQTRRSQLAAADQALGVQLAIAFVQGKLRNQTHQLQYSGKYLKSTAPARFERLRKKVASLKNIRRQVLALKADHLSRVRDQLMGLEGTGARLYWEGVAIVLEERVEFPGRNTRGAMDPINSALNYGYGILYSRVASAIVNAGLELYAGFLHVDRAGKPALVLDLVEEFRAPVVDRVVLGLVNQGIILETDDHGLTGASRRAVADRIIERLSVPVPYEGKRWPLANVIQQQARHLAVAVRGERTYRPFSSRW